MEHLLAAEAAVFNYYPPNQAGFAPHPRKLELNAAVALTLEDSTAARLPIRLVHYVLS